MEKNIFREIYKKHSRFLKNRKVRRNKKLIICFSGIPGSGKTVLAKILEKRYRGVRINSHRIGKIMQAIGNKIKKLGRKVYLGYTVQEINKNPNGTFTVTTKHKNKIKKFHADFVVSSIPLPMTLRTLNPKPERKLMESYKGINFLSLIVIYFVIPKRDILSSSYLYFVGRPYNRISEIDKFSPEMCPTNENMIGVEISCHYNDNIWKYNDKQLFEYCIKSLEKDKIINRNEVKRTFVLRASHAYPIFYRDHEKILKNILEYIESIPNLEVTVRVGKFQYVDIDQCLVNSFELVDNILPKLK